MPYANKIRVKYPLLSAGSTQEDKKRPYLTEKVLTGK